ncbi:hypothetical protein ACQEVB_19110 [Pseudonocardia sp. CA-107938]|uniref:hypothetical protein n=1 Tax=Pseudonocardia sp. CA-107938 TaxID=3240021 RepID=UPI003D8D1C60
MEEADPLITLIAGNPGMAERLARDHADDGTGRCRVCSGGAQSGRYVWPCSLYRAAIKVHESRDAR